MQKITASFTPIGFVAATFYLCAAMAPGAQAAEVELVAPMQDFTLTEPQYPPPPGGPTTYAPSGASPNWTLTEWNIPVEKMPPFVRGSEGWLESKTPVSTLRFNRAGAASQVTISQDGSYLPCETAQGHARELDMFLSPNTTTVHAPNVPGMLKSVKDSPPLSQMSHLYQTVKVSMQGGPAPRPKGCKTNLGSIIIGVIFRNISVQPSQSILYQFVLGRLCGSGGPVPLKSCSADPTKPAIYGATNPFGNDDYLPLLNQPWVANNGQPRLIKVDLLPRIEETIETGYKGTIDRDLSHWVVGVVYPGQHIWGDVSLTSTWSDFHLVAETKAGS